MNDRFLGYASCRIHTWSIQESVLSGSRGENKPQTWMNVGSERAPNCIYRTNLTPLHHATISCLLIRLWERDENENREDSWWARMAFAELRDVKKQLERVFFADDESDCCAWENLRGSNKPRCWTHPPKNKNKMSRCRNVSTGASWRLTCKVNYLGSLGFFLFLTFLSRILSEPKLL